MLLVEPYRGRKIRRGDVVVFRLPESSETVVHRVVAFSEKGPVTKGDANDAADPWALSPEAVTGKVRYACTASGVRRVHGGPLGVFTAAAVRARRFAARLLVPILRPSLPVVRNRLFSRLWVRVCKPKVVGFRRNGESSFLLLTGGRIVGRFEPQARSWCLIRPFSAFIDVDVLPRPTLPST